MPELRFFWQLEEPEFPPAVEFSRTWAISMCTHYWYLEIDCEEGVSLNCTRCHASADDLYPDGREVLAGEFEVRPGYVLTLGGGFVMVNGELPDEDDYDRWAGRVTAVLRVEEYRSLDTISPEYDVCIEVDPRDA